MQLFRNRTGRVILHSGSALLALVGNAYFIHTTRVMLGNPGFVTKQRFGRLWWRITILWGGNGKSAQQL
jgi:hypothetical protein